MTTTNRKLVKQVIILRKDLNMRLGKSVAQGAHASQMAKDNVTDESIIALWLETGMTKICVGIGSEESLIDLYNQAKAINLPCSLIVDSGRTEFHGIETKTAVAIGPALASEIDKITKDLKLL